MFTNKIKQKKNTIVNTIPILTQFYLTSKKKFVIFSMLFAKNIFINNVYNVIVCTLRLHVVQHTI